MDNTLHSLIKNVSTNYLVNKSKPLKGNQFAKYIRRNGPKILDDLLNRKNLKIECSIGQGNWAEIPWFGIFNPEVALSAAKGIYVVYLFSADMTRLYLCQGQGVTAVKSDFGRYQYDELARRSALIRARVPEFVSNFSHQKIELSGKTSLAREYEPAIAYSKVYQTHALPEENELFDDLVEAVNLYDLLVSRGGTDNFETAVDLVEEMKFAGSKAEIIETKRYIRHSKIERNTKAADSAKKFLGTKCEGCGLSFGYIYGDRGVGFIEAHHKIPLANLREGQSVSMDPEKDFSVLCSNCHRMIHRGNTLLTVEELAALPNVKKLRKFYESLTKIT